MTKYQIERYDTFNTKGCHDEKIFGDLNCQPIPSYYYNILNDDDDNVNNVPGTPFDDALPGKKVVEDAAVPNDEDIYDDIIIDDDYILALDIYSLQNEFLKIEGVDN